MSVVTPPIIPFSAGITFKNEAPLILSIKSLVNFNFLFSRSNWIKTVSPLNDPNPR